MIFASPGLGYSTANPAVLRHSPGPMWPARVKSPTNISGRLLSVLVPEPAIVMEAQSIQQLIDVFIKKQRIFSNTYFDTVRYGYRLRQSMSYVIMVELLSRLLRCRINSKRETTYQENKAFPAFVFAGTSNVKVWFLPAILEPSRTSLGHPPI